MLFDAATNADGRLELFGLDGAGAVVHQWQWTSGAWSAWERLGGPGVYAAAAGVNPDGRMELFGVDRSGTLVHSWQMPHGHGLERLGRVPGVYIGKPSVVTRSDGLLEVFVRGADYGMWDMRPEPLVGRPAGRPRAASAPSRCRPIPAGARNRDGRMEVFAGLIGAACGNVWQTSANGPWSGWGTLPGADPRQP